MSKEKNFNDFVSYRNEKIVFCQDGRIFLMDKDTELVDLRDCENCKQKDQRIAELEKYNTQLEYWKSKWYNSYDEIRNKYNKSNQTAVKEFAEKLLKIFYTKAYSKDYIEQKLSSAEFRELLGELLKERGIE